MVPLPDPGAPMMRVFALFPLENDLDSQEIHQKIFEKITITTNLLSETVTSDCLDALVNRLDSRVLENIFCNYS